MNQLADQAREDAVRFAREELAEAEAHLAEVRRRLADFRREHSLVDPSADVAGQSGLLNALNAELAQALVDRDVLTTYAGEGDQRVVQADRRIAAITERIEDERATLGVTGVAGTLPEVVGRYEELAVDLEFANTAYTQTLAGLAAARAEARRQSRYLAAARQPDAGDDRALPAPLPARRPDRPVPAARLGHRYARLLQRPRQPLTACRREVPMNAPTDRAGRPTSPRGRPRRRGARPRHAVAEEAARRWREENRRGDPAANAWVEEHGLPLAKYRCSERAWPTGRERGTRSTCLSGSRAAR